jgi:hypothetical protein
MILGYLYVGICFGMRNYLLKNFLSEKELKELKLTVHRPFPNGEVWFRYKLIRTATSLRL